MLTGVFPVDHVTNTPHPLVTHSLITHTLITHAHHIHSSHTHSMTITPFTPSNAPLSPFPLKATAMCWRYRAVRTGKLGQMLQHWNITLSPEVVDLMTKILRERPADRLTIEQVSTHPLMIPSCSHTPNSTTSYPTTPCLTHPLIILSLI